MEGTVHERRQSSVVQPTWLEPKQQPYTNVFVQEAANKSLLTTSTSLVEEGTSKLQIHDRHECKYFKFKLLLSR